MGLPLEGLRVLDLSTIMAGPFCSQMLADHGAEVIKVEPKGGERGRWFPPFIDEQSAIFYAMNRGKKSIVLDLAVADGKEVLKRLIAGSDILLHGFRPGVMEKMGFSYDEVTRINERIIYCVISGYGNNGPLQYCASHDLNIVGLSGLGSLIGTKDNVPVIPGLMIGGNVGGSLHAVIAILMALINRHNTGRGQYCDVAMLDGVVSTMAYSLADWAAAGALPRMGQSFALGGTASYHIYETSDGRFMSVATVENRFWKALCEIVGKPDYAARQIDPDSQEEMIAGLEAVFKEKSQAEWIEVFSSRDICVTPVLNLEEMADHPQVKAREMIVKLNDFRGSGKNMVIAGPPIKYSGKLNRLNLNFAGTGEHTLEVLALAGYSPEEITELRKKGIIMASD